MKNRMKNKKNIIGNIWALDLKSVTHMTTVKEICTQVQSQNNSCDVHVRTSSSKLSHVRSGNDDHEILYTDSEIVCFIITGFTEKGRVCWKRYVRVHHMSCFVIVLVYKFLSLSSCVLRFLNLMLKYFWWCFSSLSFCFSFNYIIVEWKFTLNLFKFSLSSEKYSTVS